MKTARLSSSNDENRAGSYSPTTVYCLLLKVVSLRVVDFGVARVGDDAHLVKALVGMGRKIGQSELSGEERVKLAQVVVEADRRARALEEGAPARLVREALKRTLAVGD